MNRTIKTKQQRASINVKKCMNELVEYNVEGKAVSYLRSMDMGLLAEVEQEFCARNFILPIARAGSETVIILSAEVLSVQKRKELEFAFGKKVEVQLEAFEVVSAGISKAFATANGNLIDSYLTFAESSNATDVHIEPECECYKILFRIDGSLVKGPFEELSIEEGEKLVRSLIVKSEVDINQKQVFQDGVFRTSSLEVRSSFLDSVNGKAATLRLLKRSSNVNIQLSAEVSSLLQLSLAQPSGLVLISGSTGSGKSTFLHSCLSLLVQRKKKIISFEDPVERIVKGTCQIDSRGQELASLVCSALRHDPDVIAVGEVRTRPQVDAVLKACQTGHLVFSTIHAGSCKEAVSRLESLVTALKAVFRVVLVKKPCQQCRETVSVDPVLQRLLSLPERCNVISSLGCKHCGESGASGRMMLVEGYANKKIIFSVTSQLRDLLTSQKISQEEVGVIIGISAKNSQEMLLSSRP